MANKPRVSVQITADSTGYTAAVNKAKGQLVEFGATSKRVHGAAISDVQATSGALRLLDGGINNNIRSAERFLASIKGVGTALQFIYPAVGLIAVGAVIAKGVAALTEFTKKTKEAGAEFQRSFQEMQNSARLSNDELAKTNVNLENQIAKLTGKHENVLAAQLIEARIQADNLATSAAHAGKEIKDLLEKNEAGFLAQTMGSGPTNEVFGNINNFQGLKAQARQDQSDALHNGDKKSADAADARYKQLLKNERAYLLQQREFRSGTGDRDGAFSGDQTRNLTAINAALNLNSSQSDRTDLDAENLKEAKRLKIVEDAKNVADKASEAQSRAEAAQRKADEDHLRALQEQFELQKLAMNPWETKTNFEQRQRLAQSSFYLGHLKDFKTDATRKEVFDLGQKPLDEYNTTDTEGRAALQKMLAGNGTSEGIFAGLGSDKDTQARLKAQQEAASAQAELANKLRETALSQDLQSGAISKYDAAVQMATLHTEAYQLQLEKLQAEAQQITNDPTLNEEQRRSKLIGIGSQIGSLGQDRTAQIKQDQVSVSDQTALGGWKTALDQFVQQSRDTASQLKEIWSSALSSVNEEIVKVISTRHNYGVRREFGNIGSGIFRGIAGAGLQKGEGALLGALGLGSGKPDGSQSKPFHVIMAGAAGVGSSVASGVSNAVGGLGGFLGKIGGFFSGLGFASGGMPPVGMASLVGENGPELFVPHTAGTVVPNGAFGGGDTHITLGGIDLRGASDPAAFEAIANRVFSKHVPAMISASTRAQHESNLRKPSSRR